MADCRPHRALPLYRMGTDIAAGLAIVEALERLAQWEPLIGVAPNGCIVATYVDANGYLTHEQVYPPPARKQH